MDLTTQQLIDLGMGHPTFVARENGRGYVVIAKLKGASRTFCQNQHYPGLFAADCMVWGLARGEENFLKARTWHEVRLLNDGGIAAVVDGVCEFDYSE